MTSKGKMGGMEKPLNGEGDKVLARLLKTPPQPKVTTKKSDKVTPKKKGGTK